VYFFILFFKCHIITFTCSDDICATLMQRLTFVSQEQKPASDTMYLPGSTLVFLFIRTYISIHLTF